MFDRLTRALPLVLTLILISFIPQQESHAAAVTVPCGGDVAAAVSSASSGDTINLASGCTYNTGSEVVIDKSLTINGNGATLDGGGTVRVIRNSGAAVTINNVTVTNGSAFNGGGIYSVGTLIINNSSISGNSADSNGGGIFNYGDLIINNSTNSNNTANNGGGIYNFFDTLTINDSCISDNISTSGADVHHDGSTTDAANNWWGAANGPSGNGPGSGDSVNTGVTYTPFLTASPFPDCAIASGGTSIPVPPDHRINWRHGDTDAVLYAAQDDAGNPALHVYCLNAAGDAFLGFAVTQDDLDAYPEQPDTNVEVARNDDCPVSFHILTTGEYQVNIGPDAEGQVREVIFTGLPPADVYFDDFNVYGDS